MGFTIYWICLCMTIFFNIFLWFLLFYDFFLLFYDFCFFMIFFSFTLFFSSSFVKWFIKYLSMKLDNCAYGHMLAYHKLKSDSLPGHTLRIYYLKDDYKYSYYFSFFFFKFLFLLIFLLWISYYLELDIWMPFICLLNANIQMLKE